MRPTALIAAFVVAASPIVAFAATNEDHAAAKAKVHAATAQTIVKITMPGDLSYAYKAGPGQVVAQTYCLTCHSSGYVTMQPPMDAAHWSKTVTKMRKLYGMQISDDDAAKVADYLGAEYGVPKN